MTSRKPRHRRPVRCNETGQVFASSTEAARALGLNSPNISMHINGHPNHKHVGGYTFTALDRAEVPTNGSAAPTPALLCRETGQVFRNPEHAVSVLGLNLDKLITHLEGNVDESRVLGYSFQPVRVMF